VANSAAADRNASCVPKLSAGDVVVRFNMMNHGSMDFFNGAVDAVVYRITGADTGAVAALQIARTRNPAARVRAS
jgi:hypothetical protein